MLPCEEWGMHGFPTRPGIGWIGDSRLWTLDVGGLGSRVFLQGAEPAPIATTAEPSGIARNFPGNNRSWISFEIGPESPEDRNIVRWEVQDVDVQIPLKTTDDHGPGPRRPVHHSSWKQRAVARGRGGRSSRLHSPTPPPPSRDSINALDYVS